MNLLYTYSFWDVCWWGWFSQCTIFKSGLFRADFQKECGFWVDSSGFWVHSGLISTKTTFLLRILLVKVVFSNHHFQYFQIWLFRAHFQKEWGFWVDSGLISSKTMFLLTILLVKVVFSYHHFQIWLFRADFHKRMRLWRRLSLNLSKSTQKQSPFHPFPKELWKTALPGLYIIYISIYYLYISIWWNLGCYIHGKLVVKVSRDGPRHVGGWKFQWFQWVKNI